MTLAFLIYKRRLLPTMILENFSIVIEKLSLCGEIFKSMFDQKRKNYTYMWTRYPNLHFILVELNFQIERSNSWALESLRMSECSEETTSAYSHIRFFESEYSCTHHSPTDSNHFDHFQVRVNQRKKILCIIQYFSL